MIRFLVCFFVTYSVFAQKRIDLPIVPIELKNNASNVVVESKINITILSQSLYRIKDQRMVVVYNDQGMSSLSFKEYYSKNDKVKNIQVSVYDQNGMLQKTIKEKEFKDYSLSSGMSITDTRVLELDYRTNNYPVVFIYESELESKNTAFLPRWYPIDYYGKSIMKSTFSIDGLDKIDIDSKLYNSSFFPVKRLDSLNYVEFVLEDFPAMTKEVLAPSDPRLFLPYVLSSAKRVSLEGVSGSFKNWEELGNWYHNTFIEGTEALSPATYKHIEELVYGIVDPIEKARVLYEYMQSKTRYISIQLGIGGWRPMLAKEVDVLGYGDCKGLTNYYRALLKAVGIESYPVIVTGSNSPINIESESVCLQGNHMILAIPVKDEYQWVECTSQKIPFGHIAGFTDNREVLVVKEVGSELVRTRKYESHENIQKSNVVYNLNEMGDVEVILEIESSGKQLDNRSFIHALDSMKKDKVYRKILEDFKNIIFNTIDVHLDMNKATLKESISFRSDRYATKLGDRLIIPIANWNKYGSVFGNEKKRKLPVFLNSDWIDIDEVEVNFPKGYGLDFVPEKVEINSDFGVYMVSLRMEGNKLFYQREFSSKGGLISIDNYNSYRDFREMIASKDQIKIVIRKINK